MSAYTRETRQYQQLQINSADPLRLVVLSYESVISHIANARRSIDSGAIEARSRHINRACAIIADLQGSLDMKRGGEIGVSLDRLYNYITRRLCEANAANDSKRLEECHGLLSTLWTAWREIADKNIPSKDADMTASPTPVSLAAHG